MISESVSPVVQNSCLLCSLCLDDKRQTAQLLVGLAPLLCQRAQDRRLLLLADNAKPFRALGRSRLSLRRRRCVLGPLLLTPTKVSRYGAFDRRGGSECAAYYPLSTRPCRELGRRFHRESIYEREERQLDKLEGPKYARVAPKGGRTETARARDRQAAAASQDEAEGSPTRQRKKRQLNGFITTTRRRGRPTPPSRAKG